MRTEEHNIRPSKNEVVTFRINAEMISNLKKIANHVSVVLKKEITYVDLIRILLTENFAASDDEEFLRQCDFAQQICTKITKQAAMDGIKSIPSVFIVDPKVGIVDHQQNKA